MSALYEKVSAQALLGPHADLLAGPPGRLALDVEAGSGRDGAFLAGLGFVVVAAEPAAGMRTPAGDMRRLPSPCVLHKAKGCRSRNLERSLAG